MSQKQQSKNPQNPQEQSPKKEKEKKEKEKKRNQNLDQFNTYAKYSGLAFQMIVIIGLAVWGGLRLDNTMGNRFPVMMIFLALLAFGLSLYVVIKGLPKD